MRRLLQTVREGIRAIAGDAAWEAIKWLGLPIMSTIGAFVLSLIQGQPLEFIVIVALNVFFVVAAVAYILWKVVENRSSKPIVEEEVIQEESIPSHDEDDYDELRKRQTEFPKDFISIEPERLITDSKPSESQLTLLCLARSCLLTPIEIDSVEGQFRIPFPTDPTRFQNITFRLRPEIGLKLAGLLENPMGGTCNFILDSQMPTGEIAKQLVGLDKVAHSIEGTLFVTLRDMPTFPVGIGKSVKVIDNNRDESFIEG